MRIHLAFALVTLACSSEARSQSLGEELGHEVEEIHRLDAELAATQDGGRAYVLLARAARLKQSAIRQAIADFQIDVAGVATGVNYSPHGAMRERDGATLLDADGTIRVQIGDRAFRSAGWLGSTIAHEVEVHVNRQIVRGNRYQPSDREGTLVQEVEAYDFEILSQQRFGLDAEELREVKHRRNGAYRALQWDNRKRIDEGRYARL